jgi:hypothetical protein
VGHPKINFWHYAHVSKVEFRDNHESRLGFHFRGTRGAPRDIRGLGPLPLSWVQIRLRQCWSRTGQQRQSCRGSWSIRVPCITGGYQFAQWRKAQRVWKGGGTAEICQVVSARMKRMWADDNVLKIYFFITWIFFSKANSLEFLSWVGFDTVPWLVVGKLRWSLSRHIYTLVCKNIDIFFHLWDDMHICTCVKNHVSIHLAFPYDHRMHDVMCVKYARSISVVQIIGQNKYL